MDENSERAAAHNCSIALSSGAIERDHVRSPGEGGPTRLRRASFPCSNLALANPGQGSVPWLRGTRQGSRDRQGPGFSGSDIDDRDETVGKKIRDAGREWIPYVVVIGDEELDSGTSQLPFRAESMPKSPAKSKMTVEYLRRRVSTEIAGKPSRLPLPMKLAERPVDLRQKTCKEPEARRSKDYDFFVYRYWFVDIRISLLRFSVTIISYKYHTPFLRCWEMAPIIDQIIAINYIWPGHINPACDSQQVRILSSHPR